MREATRLFLVHSGGASIAATRQACLCPGASARSSTLRLIISVRTANELEVRVTQSLLLRQTKFAVVLGVPQSGRC